MRTLEVETIYSLKPTFIETNRSVFFFILKSYILINRELNMSNNTTKVKVEVHPDFRTINVSGLIGIHSAVGIQLVLHSEELDCTESLSEPIIDTKKLRLKRILECRLSLDPYAAKVLQNVLNTQISKYEERFGKIPDPNINEKSDQGKTDTKINTSGVYT